MPVWALAEIQVIFDDSQLTILQCSVTDSEGSVLRLGEVSTRESRVSWPLHCSALQYTALHCITLQCTVVHCSTLHCTAHHCTALHHTVDLSAVHHASLLLDPASPAFPPAVFSLHCWPAVCARAQGRHRSLITYHWSLHTTHWSLLTDHCTLLTDHCTLLTDHCTPLTDHRSLHTTHYSLLTAHFWCTLHTSPCTRQVITSHCTRNTAHWTLCWTSNSCVT